MARNHAIMYKKSTKKYLEMVCMSASMSCSQFKKMRKIFYTIIFEIIENLAAFQGLGDRVVVEPLYVLVLFSFASVFFCLF